MKMLFLIHRHFIYFTKIKLSITQRFYPNKLNSETNKVSWMRKKDQECNVCSQQAQDDSKSKSKGVKCKVTGLSWLAGLGWGEPVHDTNSSARWWSAICWIYVQYHQDTPHMPPVIGVGDGHLLS